MSIAKPAWSIGARQGELHRHKQIVFFACEGLIALYDERTPEEDFSIMLPSDLRQRATALARYGKSCVAADNSPTMREEGRTCLQDADAMDKAANEAAAMGDPSDPAVQAYWARHRPGSKSVVSLRAGSDPTGYPSLPGLPLGPLTARTAKADGVAMPVANDTHLRLYSPPKRKNRHHLILDV